MPVKIRIGTSGYSYKEWKGKFYPEDLSAKKMLHFYGGQLNTVESNSTFRMIPKAAVVEAWTKEVPDDFRFALKAPQQITHFRRLRDVEEPLERFVEVAGVLKARLGPMLFQLPPNLKQDLPRLEAFLRLLPNDKQFAIEFRHESWFGDEVFELLKTQNVALCLADADETLSTPFVATANFGYLRLRMPSYTKAELSDWIKRIRQQKWGEAYVFFKHEDEGNGPIFAKQMMDLASK